MKTYPKRNLSKSKRKTHPVERKSTLPDLFCPVAQLQDREDGSDKETFRILRIILLTSPTKFSRKPEKLNLYSIGISHIPCFTEEYMHNSFKNNEYVLLKDLESFLFLMVVCIYYPIFYEHRF